MPIVLVTGATDGIGLQTAHDLAKRGFTVVVHGRTDAKSRAAIDTLHRALPDAKLEPAHADLGSFAEIRALGADLAARFPVLDAVVHNAGLFAKSRTESTDGMELSFQVNHLAPFLLTHLLLSSLEAAGGRVVSVSSIAHARATLDFSNLQGEKHFDGYDAYARGKLANVLFALELARRAPKLRSNALHPGVVTTKLLRTGFGSGGPDSLEQGASTSVFLASSPDAADVTGKYFVRSRVAAHNPLADDAKLRARFWDVSAKLVGLG